MANMGPFESGKSPETRRPRMELRPHHRQAAPAHSMDLL